MTKARLFILLAVLAAVGWCFTTGPDLKTGKSLLIVEVLSSPQRSKLLRQQLDDFERINPGVSVDVISLPWGQAFEKLSMMIRGGQVPDVIEMPDFWVSRYVKGGLITDMEGYFKKSDFGPDLAEDLIDYGRLQGKDQLYTIPYGFYLRAMLYNKKIFRKAGIERPPLTLEEFYDTAARISELPNTYGFCHHGARGGAIFYYWLIATMNGSEKFFDDTGRSTFDSPGAIRALQFITDMYQKGYVPKDSLNWGFNETVSGFNAGRCAMLHQTPDVLVTLRKRMDEADFASAPMPLGPSGKSFPHMGFIGWSIFKLSRHQDLSWKLIEHLLARKQHLPWTKLAGVVPIYRDLSEKMFAEGDVNEGWYREITDPRWGQLINPNHLEDIAYFDSVTVVQSGQEMLLGNKSPEETAHLWARFLTSRQQEWMAKEGKGGRDEN